MKTLLRIRLLQTRRESADLNLLHFAVLLLIAILVFGSMFQQASNSAGIAWLFAGLIAFSVGGLHFQRKDHRLLALAIKDPRPLLATEYLLLALPFSLTLFLAARPLPAICCLLLSALFAWVPVRPKRGGRARTWLSRWIPADNFEWIAGVRKLDFAIAFLYIAALVLTPKPIVSLMLLWFLLLMISEFYRYGEPRSWLPLYAPTQRDFLHKKLRRHIGLHALVIAPVLLAYAFFQPDKWWIPAAYLLFSSIAMACMILAKYSAYTPNNVIRANSTITALVLLSVVVIFFLPVPVMALGWYYIRARKHDLWP